jgi:hypothetical protein
VFAFVDMFCPSCGKGDQSPETYCRSCGEFLMDYSARSFLLSKLVGGSTPETQVKVNLIISAVTALISALLLGFLNGYYDALYERTRETPPPIIYLVYLFLGLVMAWQLLSFVIGLRLKSKIGGRRKGLPADDPAAGPGALPPGTTRESLPPADVKRAVSTSVTEEATRILDERPRK